VDSALLAQYERDLRRFRGASKAMGAAFPQIAGRLDATSLPAIDPHVERLIEAGVYLGSRIARKTDAQREQIATAILSALDPHASEPVPSMGVVQFSRPPATAIERVPRGTRLLADIEHVRSRGEFRTGIDVELTPLRIVEAGADRASGEHAGSASRVTIRFETEGGLPLSQCRIDDLVLFVRGADDVAVPLLESILCRTTATYVDGSPVALPRPRPVGFEPNEALLHRSPLVPAGQTPLREYLHFHKRFLFFRVSGLVSELSDMEGTGFALVIETSRRPADWTRAVSAQTFALHCTPIVNLFPKRVDRVRIDDSAFESHVIADRAHPDDYEVVSLSQVSACFDDPSRDCHVEPLLSPRTGRRLRYTTRRLPRKPSQRQRRLGRRAKYLGAELYIMLSDEEEPPFPRDLRWLSIRALCTNRDLPLLLSLGRGSSDFDVDSRISGLMAKMVAGPTPPRPSPTLQVATWNATAAVLAGGASIPRAGSGSEGAELAQFLVRSLGPPGEPPNDRLTEGIERLVAARAELPHAVGGAPSPVEGIDLSYRLADDAFEGRGALLLAVAMHRYFESCAPLNTVIRTRVELSTGERVLWAPSTTRSANC